MHTFTWFNAFTLSQSDALVTAQFSQVREMSLLFRSEWFKEADKYKRRQTHVAILEPLHVSPLQKLPY